MQIISQKFINYSLMINIQYPYLIRALKQLYSPEYYYNNTHESRLKVDWTHKMTAWMWLKEKEKKNENDHHKICTLCNLKNWFTYRPLHIGRVPHK